MALSITNNNNDNSSSNGTSRDHSTITNVHISAAASTASALSHEKTTSIERPKITTTIDDHDRYASTFQLMIQRTLMCLYNKLSLLLQTADNALFFTL
jgi:hypothetical protein